MNYLNKFFVLLICFNLALAPVSALEFDLSVDDEIKSLGDGRYSFWVGRQKYTLATKLEPARFCRIAEGVSSLVAGFPPNLSQDERLVLALMSLAFRLEDMGERVGGLCAEFGGEEKKA